MYNDIMYIINMSAVGSSTLISTSLYYYYLGYNLGDFVTRLFYRTEGSLNSDGTTANA